MNFLRFELTPEMVSGVKDGSGLSVGIDHSNYQLAVTVDDETRDSLAGDLG